MEGNQLIDRLMHPVIDAMVRNGIRGTARTEIYNRAYEAVLNGMTFTRMAKNTTLIGAKERHRKDWVSNE